MKLEVNLVQLWRAKSIIYDKLKSNVVDEYAKLWRYVLEIRKSNPENTVILETNEDDTFKRIYISFNACKKGFFSWLQKGYWC